jgi:hypothetical protein
MHQSLFLRNVHAREDAVAGMDEAKKKIEQTYINEIQCLYADFPPGLIIPSEAPDFLMHSDSKIYGFEIVRYVRKISNSEISEKKSEAQHELLVDSAKALFESRNQTPLLVVINWYSNFLVTGKNKKLIVSELVEKIENNIPLSLHETTTLTYKNFALTVLMGCCHAIHINRQERTSLWRSSSSGFITLHKREIESVISTKEEKLPSYLKKCDAVWLIIVCDASSMSSTCSSEYITQGKFHYSFEKVLLYIRNESLVLPIQPY